MKTLFTIALLVAATATTNAQVQVSASGLSTVTIDSTGTLTFSANKVTLNFGPNPPGPNPPLPPGPLTERGKAIMTAALAVQGDPDRAGTAHGLARLYRDVADIFDKAPAATPDQLTTALTLANVKYFSDKNVLTVWSPFRDTFGKYWTQALAAPATTVAGECAKLMREAAGGLDASAPSVDVNGNNLGFTINPDTLKLILQIITMILQLLQPHAAGVN